jgi:preprotein translocase subunit SecY
MPLNVNFAGVVAVVFQPELLKFPAPSKNTSRSPKNGVYGGVAVYGGALGPIHAVARAA